MIDLNEYKSNEHSQYGEDGIISRLLHEMGIEIGVFCEFGAWDGMHLSNTYALYKKGWHGVYIEGDKQKFKSLERNINSERVDLICAYVQPDGINSLDNLLNNSSLLNNSPQLDLLSIDIDSDDLAIFSSIQSFKASIVVIEFNPTIPPDVEYINPPGENKGNSAYSILRIASERRYKLVAFTSTNLILVTENLLPQTIKVMGFDDLYRLPGQRYFFGYDGTMLVSTLEDEKRVVREYEFISVPWKKSFFPQPTPGIFRQYEQGIIMKVILLSYLFLFTFLFRPIAAFREVGRRLMKSRKK